MLGRRAGYDDPGRGHDLRRQVVHLHPQDAASGGALEEGGGREKGSGQPNKVKVGSVTQAQVQKIAELKMPDLNTDSLESAMAMVAGAARSMGMDGDRLMRTHGKKYTAAARSPRGHRRIRPSQAISLVKDMAFAKFDETVEVAVRLGVDPRHADQVVRGTVVLPEGTGKTMRVLVIATGPRFRKPGGGRRFRRHRVPPRSRTAGWTSTS
jgi:hypothetical protein